MPGSNPDDRMHETIVFIAAGAAVRTIRGRKTKAGLNGSKPARSSLMSNNVLGAPSISPYLELRELLLILPPCFLAS